MPIYDTCNFPNKKRYLLINLLKLAIQLQADTNTIQIKTKINLTLNVLSNDNGFYKNETDIRLDRQLIG